jgi:hypothetical protein
MRYLWTNFGLAKAAELPSTTPGREWELYITASTPRQDHEGEVVLQKALIDAAPYFLARGRLTWEHITPETRFDPSIYIGEPLDAKFTPNQRTLVKGWLYQSLNKPKAREAWGILESGGHLYASIGGAILPEGRTVTKGRSTVSKVLWTHTALTPYPMNDDAEVQNVPYDEFLKALGTEGAGPMVMEDLEGARLKGTAAFAQKWRALTQTILQQYPGYDEDRARQAALAHLIRTGEARQAYVSAPNFPQPEELRDEPDDRR